MNKFRNIIKKAKRRIAVARAVYMAGRALVVAIVIAIVVVIIDKLMNLELSAFAYVGIITAGLVIGVAISLLRKIDTFDVAVQLDRRLGLRDRLGTAEAIRTGEVINDEFGELITRDAERVANNLDIKAATPIRFTNDWPVAGLLVIALGASIAFVPSLDRSTSGQSPLEIAKQQEQLQQQQQEIAETIEDAVLDVDDELLDEKVREDLEALKQLSQQLSEDDKSSEEVADARNQSAAELGEIANRLEEQAERNTQTVDSIAERFAGMEQAETPMSAEEFTEALRSGEFENAAELLDELEREAEQMTQSERDAVADQFRNMSEQLSEEEGESEIADEEIDQVRDAMRDLGMDDEAADELLDENKSEQEISNALEEQGVDEDIARELAEDVKDAQEQDELDQQVDEQAKEIADALNDAADEIEQDEPQSQQSESQQEKQSEETSEEAAEETDQAQTQEQDKQKESEQQIVDPDESEKPAQKEISQEEKDSQNDEAQKQDPDSKSQQQSKEQSKGKEDPDAKSKSKKLGEALRELAKKKRDAAKGKQSSERLRDAAKKLADSLSDEEKRELTEKWMSEINKPADDTDPQTGTGKNGKDKRGSAADRIMQNSDDELKADTEDIDVTGDKPAEKTIFEWLSDQPHEGDPKRTTQSKEVLRKAHSAAEHAVGESTVPKRYHDLIQRYFGKLNDTVEKASKQAAESETKTKKTPAKTKAEDDS